MNIDILSLHFYVALDLRDFLANFVGAPAAIFACCFWCFRAIGRSAK